MDEMSDFLQQQINFIKRKQRHDRRWWVKLWRRLRYGDPITQLSPAKSIPAKSTEDYQDGPITWTYCEDK